MASLVLTTSLVPRCTPVKLVAIRSPWSSRARNVVRLCSKQEFSSACEKAAEAAKNGANTGAKKTKDSAEKVSETTQEVSGKAKETVQDAWGTVKDTTEKIKDTVVGTAEKSTETIKEGAKTLKRNITG